MENRLAELLALPANKTCIDCNAAHPQWASVNNGVFFCLECSGIHRSLGVQTSFVRSVTMDRWTPEQVARMEAGGNARALKFWRSRPDWREGLSIREKYNSDFARRYRDQLNGDGVSSGVCESLQNLSSKSSFYSAAESCGEKKISSFASYTNSPIPSSSSGGGGDWFGKIKQQVSNSIIEPVKSMVSSGIPRSEKSKSSISTTGKKSSKTTIQDNEDNNWSW